MSTADPVRPVFLEAHIVVKQLGSQSVIATCTVRGREAEIVDAVRERTPHACRHLPPKTRRGGCEVQVSVGALKIGSGRAAGRQQLRETCLAEPDNIAHAAAVMTADCAKNLRTMQAQDNVSDVLEDVIGTAVRVITEAQAWVPRIADAANGNATGVIVGIGQQMAQDPAGRDIFASVTAAASGDADALKKITEQTKDMGPIGPLLQQLFSTMGK